MEDGGDGVARVAVYIVQCSRLGFRLYSMWQLSREIATEGTDFTGWRGFCVGCDLRGLAFMGATGRSPLQDGRAFSGCGEVRHRIAAVEAGEGF